MVGFVAVWLGRCGRASFVVVSYGGVCFGRRGKSWFVSVCRVELWRVWAGGVSFGLASLGDASLGSAGLARLVRVWEVRTGSVSFGRQGWFTQVGSR